MTISIVHATDNDDQFAATTYGSFIHFKSVPNALFFFEEIEDEDSFELRKALRTHDIDTIVLSSPGGKVFEGLQMAGIIYDRKLTTFVPKFGECVSACAFMFFAGDVKVATGELGVHQFSKDEEGQKKKEPVGVTNFVSQFTVSEIIGFLNEFETPPFVFERMFATKKIYYFSPEELKKIAEPKIDGVKPIKWIWDEDTKRLIPNLSENNNLQGIENFLERLSKFLEEEECSEDSSECSSEQLCSRAAKNNTWVTDEDGHEFVKEAKLRGLSCDVMEQKNEPWSEHNVKSALFDFAQDFKADPKLPKMSIILLDDGTHNINLDILEAFPYPITFALAPSWKGAAAAMKNYRRRDFEVIVLAEFADDVIPEEARILLQNDLRRLPEAVAVMEAYQGSLRARPAMLERITKLIKSTGHGLVLLPKALGTVNALVVKTGVQTATISQRLDDKDQNARQIRKILDQAILKARNDGAVIVIGKFRYETIKALMLWGLQDRVNHVALAPISALLLDQTSNKPASDATPLENCDAPNYDFCSDAELCKAVMVNNAILEAIYDNPSEGFNPYHYEARRRGLSCDAP
ncbi:divergent polysaccharide deacetylase family protein [bacterium]|nr:divergent polysaccharide deacetylase family protein [bacterium]